MRQKPPFPGASLRINRKGTETLNEIIIYNGQQTATYKMLAERLNVKESTLSMNKTRAQKAGIPCNEGEHYFIVKGDELRTLKVQYPEISKSVNELVLWTEIGILMHMNMSQKIAEGELTEAAIAADHVANVHNIAKYAARAVLAGHRLDSVMRDPNSVCIPNPIGSAQNLSIGDPNSVGNPNSIGSVVCGRGRRLPPTKIEKESAAARNNYINAQAIYKLIEGMEKYVDICEKIGMPASEGFDAFNKQLASLGVAIPVKTNFEKVSNLDAT